VLKKTSVEEPRRSIRQKLFLRGFIRTPKSATSIDCMVRDLSEGGAKLRFRCTPLITDFFELHIPAKGAVLPAKLVWMNGCEAGISLDTIDPVDTARADYSEIFVRVTTLEDEIAALKDTVKQLQSQAQKAN
jgi:PilZ domain